jgi:serine/threonine protein kinase
MKSRVASVCAGGGLDRVNRAVQLFDDEWQRHGEVQLDQFWMRERSREPVELVDSVALLPELIKADMRWRFERGETPTVAEYLDRFPELRALDSRVLSLVYEEYCLNEECGKAPDVESFCNRYPDWKSSLVSQLQYHRLFSQAAGVRPALPCFPEAGQDFEEFRLQSLLGAGGMSRVFLARDLSLGGKQVVLKVTLDRGQEPQVQGPLDHPHIVPVNSVAYQTDRRLCGLSMPYRPGLTLDEVVPLVDQASRPRKALAVWDALVRGTRDPARPFIVGEQEFGPEGEGRFASPRGDGWEGFPVRGSFEQGVAWIVMILARALHYAHRRQTYHRDIKPANLLLTLQSGPQLLDFNLADSPHSANQAQTALHGGTLPYMAPEQIEAFINPELWGEVGARADVYSLGLVLRELLTGQKPELPAAGLPPARALRAVLDRRQFLDTSVRRFNAAIPHSLEAIVAKCLALSPEDRYVDAQALEQDLDRFLRRLPLRQVANPSPRERLGNWAFRNRQIFSAAACTFVLAVTLYVLWYARPVNTPIRPKIESSSSFQGAVRDINNGKFEPAIVALSKLEEGDFQDSCLVKFYLSLALNENITKHLDADRYLTQALASPGAKPTLTGWSRNHAEVTKYLVDFADSRIKRADVLANALDKPNSSLGDEERDLEYRLPKYDLPRDALRLAEELDRESPRIQRLLARTERIFGEYEAAYRRVSALLTSPGSRQKLDGDSLFQCLRLRVWVAFLWAERDLREDPDSVNKATRDRLLQARLDLNRTDSFLQERPFRVLKDQELQLYHALHDRVRLTVTSAAVDLKLSELDAAAKSIRRAENVLGQLNDFIIVRRLQDEVPATKNLQDRLEALKEKLNPLVRGPRHGHSGNDNAPESRPATEVAASGA